MKRRQLKRDEEGQALILAILFITFASIVITALLSLNFANLSTTPVIRQNRAKNYDADQALTSAIAVMRVGSNVKYFNTTSCPSVVPNSGSGPFTNPTITWNNPSQPLRVDCIAQAPTSLPAPPFQRHVVLTICPTSVATMPCPDANSLLHADVTFYDSLTPIGVSIKTWSNQR